MVEWIEGKLEQHGVAKVVPGDLTAGYRYALEVEYIQQRMDALAEKARAHAAESAVPADLRQRVEAELQGTPTLAWDDVVHSIVHHADRKAT